MRRAISLAAFLAVGAWVVFVTHQVWAVPRFARETKAACAACHTNPAGGADLTGAGKAYQADAAKATVPTDVKGAEYVGSNKCKMCHLREYRSWQATRHAGAFAALEKADTSVVAQMAAKLKVEVTGPASQEEACVQCHVTGFQLAGGFPAADSTKNAALMNVTCEACHGPGGKHVFAKAEDRKKMINRAVTAKLCTQCHTPEMSPKFKFDEYKKLGVHAVPKAG